MKINKVGGYCKGPGQRQQWFSKEEETRRKINKSGRYLGDRINRTPRWARYGEKGGEGDAPGFWPATTSWMGNCSQRLRTMEKDQHWVVREIVSLVLCIKSEMPLEGGNMKLWKKNLGHLSIYQSIYQPTY